MKNQKTTWIDKVSIQRKVSLNQMKKAKYGRKYSIVRKIYIKKNRLIIERKNKYVILLFK